MMDRSTEMEVCRCSFIYCKKKTHKTGKTVSLERASCQNCAYEFLKSVLFILKQTCTKGKTTLVNECYDNFIFCMQTKMI